jgi:urease accessory protein
MIRFLGRSAATLALLLVAPFNAEAHLASARLGDFYGGLLHPLTGFEDALPWLALAILAAFQGPRGGRWLVLVFPLGLAAGAALSLALPGIAAAPLLGLGFVAATGLLVALGAVLPLPLFLVLGGLVALVHGYGNGEAMTRETDGVLFIAGVTAIGYVFVSLIAGTALAFLQGGGAGRAIALRAGGSWIAAVGIMVLGLQLATATTPAARPLSDAPSGLAPD